MIKKSRAELYPLTAHGMEPREFVRRWGSMRNLFARQELTAGDPYLYGDPDRMDFGGALQALKAGHHVARAGWNGRGLYVTLQDGYPDGIALNANTAEATGLPEGTPAVFRPYLLLGFMGRTGPEFVPWAPSVSDALGEDWLMVARPGSPPADVDDVTEFAGEPVRRAGG